LSPFEGRNERVEARAYSRTTAATTRTSAFLRALQLIERDGWCFVAPNHKIGYSIGLWAHCHMPEIVVIGLPDDTAYDIASATVKHGRERGLYPGLVIPRAARGRHVRIRTVERPSILAEFLGLARLYYEGIMETPLAGIPICQVEWPDSAGHYSDHPQYRATRQQRP
jgi:hypothetical protein